MQPPSYDGEHDQWPDLGQGLRDIIINPWHPEAATITHPPPPSYNKRGPTITPPPPYNKRGPIPAAKLQAAPKPGSPPQLAASKKPQRSVNPANMQQQHQLTRVSYKSKFHSLLNSEETAHSIILEARLECASDL